MLQLLFVLLTAVTVRADETPVFVSCYADDGSHLMLIFDTDKKQFTYRKAKGDVVDTFDAAPTAFGLARSAVTKNIPEDQRHIELKAQIIGGDPIRPIIDTSAEAIFDRDETGSLKLTSYSLFHLSQGYDLETFKVGVCYVQ